MVTIIACLLLLAALPAEAAAPDAVEAENAAEYLRSCGIMTGDGNGTMNLAAGLTRAELAVILTRLHGNPDHVQAESRLYLNQCRFEDVPEWARLYVGYCYANGLMVGYGGRTFGPDDCVTPQAACTVLLRYLDPPGLIWDYFSACQTTVSLGLAEPDAVTGAEISRGELAVMLHRALTRSENGRADRNEDGSINLPADGTQYIPKAGDVIRCDDGSNYTITDVSRWDQSMFASGPIGELPSPTCDWSLLPQPELPSPEARRFCINGREYLFTRNLYETRRMLYTLYNAIGDNPETWAGGAPVTHPSGNPKVSICLYITDDVTPQMFWPWRASEIVSLFNSCPPGSYSMEAWDVYIDGVYQRTEYNIHVS